MSPASMFCRASRRPPVTRGVTYNLQQVPPGPRPNTEKPPVTRPDVPPTFRCHSPRSLGERGRSLRPVPCSRVQKRASSHSPAPGGWARRAWRSTSRPRCRAASRMESASSRLPLYRMPPWFFLPSCRHSACKAAAPDRHWNC